jgi:hypothetical protein
MKILVTAALLLPAVAFASSPFDGTWKTRVDSMKVSGKPDVFEITADGIYSCPSCFPALKLKADGADHPITGNPYHDSVAVRIISATSIERTDKLHGKVMSTSTITVSADGSTLTGKFTDHTGAQVATGAFSEKRVAAGATGAHAISGTWQQQQVSDANEALRTVAYEMTPEHFSMHWNGQSYQAKFDGKEYPIEGDPGHTHVTLKKIDANTVEEIDHRMGKVTDEIRLAAAPDGKTLQITDKDLLHGQTTTYTVEKQ